MSPWENLPACVAVRVGQRSTVYLTLDEAIFALEGWPRPQFAICKEYYQAINYLNLDPADYPRWLRIIVWPETASDTSEPTVPEASEAEFRNAFVRMREMEYPEDRFPSWFIEKIPDEDLQLARQVPQAPAEAPTSIQSEWEIHFGPEQLSPARAQLSLRWGHPLRNEIESLRLRYYPASPSQLPSLDAPTAQVDTSITEAQSSQSEVCRSRVITWLAETRVRSHGSLDNQNRNDSEPSIFGSGPYVEQEEVNPIWWTLPSAPLTLLYLERLGLHEGFARDFNPATQRVDLWGVDDGDRQMDSVAACLGPIAARYFHHHYYSHGSKAVIIWAYWYHHGDANQFVKHLFRRGVLPMLATYMWELLQTSFNWKAALKIEVKNAEGPGFLRSVGAEKLDFSDCPECEGRERLVVKVERAQPGSNGKENDHK
ncbi:hypothetical protein M407DRAFT_30704 [Tulasnella calospora MUT 4182]|uniref:Uncharacterized protein n=1 Tax=Tulasnella calospora MUT 4182 TaxID=1051891 RepID=A0A0C3KDV6_9AGAM|nr:hypothetical protein M407DRAFT_30704 [Tulasnella calospora MUT 4182]